MCVCSDLPDSYYYRTAEIGQTVKFPCHTKLPEDVGWARLDTPKSTPVDIYLGSIKRHDLGLDPRFTVLDESHSKSLVMHNVTVNDSAYYRCVEERGFGNRHYFVLTVEGKLLIN